MRQTQGHDRNSGGTGRTKRDVFLPLAIGDYLRDTPHFRARQHGGYLLLLMAAWVCGGRLAYGDEDLRTIAHQSPEEWVEDRPRFARLFRIAGDGSWIHRGMQRRMRRLGIPVDLGPDSAPSAPEGGANYSGGDMPSAVDPALSAKRSEAARRSWEARRGGAADAKPDANLHRSDAKPDANGDANLHPDLHVNLNLKESSNHQPSSLPAAREAAKSSPALGDGGGLVDRLLKLFNNPAWVNASVYAEVIREWRGLGLSDDAICIEVASVLDAKRMQTPGFMPSHPNYCTPALKRLAEREAAEAPRLPPDPWDQRVASYAKSKFWLDDMWGGRPDSDRPNPAIARALLVRYGFVKEAA